MPVKLVDRTLVRTLVQTVVRMQVQTAAARTVSWVDMPQQTEWYSEWGHSLRFLVVKVDGVREAHKHLDQHFPEFLRLRMVLTQGTLSQRPMTTLPPLPILR